MFEISKASTNISKPFTLLRGYVMTVATMKNEEVDGHARCEDVADSVQDVADSFTQYLSQVNKVGLFSFYKNYCYFL